MKIATLVLSLIVCLGVSASDWDKQLWDGVVEKNPAKVREALDNGANIHQKIDGYNILMQLPVRDFRDAYVVFPNQKINIKLDGLLWRVGFNNLPEKVELCDPTNPDFSGTSDEEIRAYLDTAINNRLSIIKMIVEKAPDILFEVKETDNRAYPEGIRAVDVLINASVTFCKLPVHGEKKPIGERKNLYKTQKYSIGNSASLITPVYIEYLLSLEQTHGKLSEAFRRYLIHRHGDNLSSFLRNRERARGVARGDFWWEETAKIFNLITSQYPELKSRADNIIADDISYTNIVREQMRANGEKVD